MAFSPSLVSSRIVPVLLATLSLSACFGDGSSSNGGSQAGVVPTSSSGDTASNKAPVVSGTPATAVPAGFPYVFKPVASDPEGDPLTFSVAGLPSWAEFVGTTGELRGVPSEADLGQSSGITITVSDGQATTSFGPFRVAVNRAASAGTTGGTRPPVISGTAPGTVAAGTTYNFQAAASDPDGDRLTFGAKNLPSWLGINTANGALTGTPTVAQVGIYSGISLSVTDGVSTVSLPAFTIIVTAAGTATTTPTTPTTPATGGAAAGTAVTTGSATLSWSKPTLNSDGTALTDLAGFVVEYGTDSAALSQRVSVADPNLTRYTVPNLGKGTWYFTVISYTATGLQSDVAKLVSKTIS